MNKEYRDFQNAFVKIPHKRLGRHVAYNSIDVPKWTQQWLCGREFVVIEVRVLPILAWEQFHLEIFL